MELGDTETRATGNSEKRRPGSRRMSSNVLLLESPPRLDRVEDRRVRREVEHPDTKRLAPGSHSYIVMGGQVIEHQHIPTLESRKQFRDEPCHEAVLIGGGEHSAQKYPTGYSDRSEQSEVWAPVHRRPLNVLGPLLDPGMASRHCEVESRFIEEDEPLDRDAAHDFQERRALFDDVWAELLERSEAFFFTTNPPRCRARLMLETWCRSSPRRPRLYSAAISPAVGSPSFSTIDLSSGSEISDGVPPRFFRGLTCPSRRYRSTHRRTVIRLTLKRAAIVPYPPSPDSYASTTRRRNSIEWGSAIPTVDQISDRAARIMLHSAEQWG